MDLERAGEAGFQNPLTLYLATLVELWSSPQFRARLIDDAVEGLGTTEARVLWELGYRRSSRPGVLAVAIGVGAPSITKAVARLRGFGLVAIAADPTDARAAMLRLTDDGKTVSQRIYRAGDDLTEQLTSGWTPDEIKTLTELLARLTASALEIADNPALRRPDVTNRAGRPD